MSVNIFSLKTIVTFESDLNLAVGDIVDIKGYVCVVISYNGTVYTTFEEYIKCKITEMASDSSMIFWIEAEPLDKENIKHEGEPYIVDRIYLYYPLESRTFPSDANVVIKKV